MEIKARLKSVAPVWSAGKLFDPVVVDLVEHIPSGELLRRSRLRCGSRPSG